ncbi:hypothetical protein BGZ76_011920 [Entomortierella beljakovae]|nr:hypothetical protein BGZ76_011920 [Entomortierella beljakovae]
MDKRKDPPTSEGVLIKRQKPEESSSTSNAVTIQTKGASGALIQTVKRTSALKAPIMLLQGQGGELYTSKFSPSGDHIASAGEEKCIYLWNTYGECSNYGVIKGHNGPILELHWSRDGSMIFTASADKTCGVYDVQTGERIKRFKGHTSFVNSCSPAKRGPELLASGSDDGSVKIWDLRSKNAVESFDSQYQITAVSFSDAGDLVFAGGIDNNIAAWDMRKKNISYTLTGHMDTVSGISLSPDGNQLLSNAMDNTVRIWDVKPFSASGNRLLKTFEGAPHGFEKNLIRPAWSHNGSMIGVGAGDRNVVIWDTLTRKILYKLPGHKGCVNEIDFHPKEPIGPVSVTGAAFVRSRTKLFVQGGVVISNGNTVAQQNQFYALDLAIAWNVDNPTWVALKQGPTLSYHSISISADEKTLVTFRTGSAGSTLSYRYHVSTNSWDQSTVKVPTPNKEGVSAIEDKVSGLVYLAGGYQSDDTQMYVYNIETDTMTMFPMPSNYMTDRLHYSGVYLTSRKSILYFGGSPYNSQQQSQNLITEYMPSTGSWSTLYTNNQNPPHRTEYCMATNDDGTKIVVFGGKLDNGYARDIWILDIASLTWTQGPSWTEPRVSSTCTIAGSTFISWGGSNGQRTISSIILFDLNSGQYVSSYTPPTTYVDIAQGGSINMGNDGNRGDRGGSPHDHNYDPYYNLGGLRPDLAGEQTKSSSLIIVGSIIGSIILIAVVALASVFVRRQRQRNRRPSQCISFNNGTTPRATRTNSSHSLATLTSQAPKKNDRFGETRDAITADEEKYIVPVQAYNPSSLPQAPAKARDN